MGAGVGVNVAVGVRVGVAVGVFEAVGVRVGDALGVAVAVFDGLGVTVGVRVRVGVTVGVAVGLGVRVLVTVVVRVGMGVAVDGTGVRVGLDVNDGDAGGVGVTVNEEVEEGVDDGLGSGAKRPARKTMSAAPVASSALRSDGSQTPGSKTACTSRSNPHGCAREIRGATTATVARAMRMTRLSLPAAARLIASFSTGFNGQPFPFRQDRRRCTRPRSGRDRATAAVAAPLQGRGVGVATRTTICLLGPTLPRASRNRAVRTDSPGGNTAVAATISQNCDSAAGSMKPN